MLKECVNVVNHKITKFILTVTALLIRVVYPGKESMEATYLLLM